MIDLIVVRFKVNGFWFYRNDMWAFIFHVNNTGRCLALHTKLQLVGYEHEKELVHVDFAVSSTNLNTAGAFDM